MTSPRNPAVDAVLTAETLLAQFRGLIPKLSSLSAADVSVAVGEAQSLYPELWAALDRGRTVLRNRGVDLPTFDEVRARQPAAMLGVQVNTRDRSAIAEAATVASFLLGGVTGVVVGTAIDAAGGLGAKQGEANSGGLHDASIALHALRGAMPEVDWKTIRTREAHAASVLLDDLARARQKKVLLAVAFLAVVALVGWGLVTILQNNRAPTEDEKRAQADAERREAQREISELNAQLKETPCDAKAAERRVELFQNHNRSGTARKLATQFVERCGDHAKLSAIAGVPSGSAGSAESAASEGTEGSGGSAAR